MTTTQSQIDACLKRQRTGIKIIPGAPTGVEMGQPYKCLGGAKYWDTTWQQVTWGQPATGQKVESCPYYSSGPHRGQPTWIFDGKNLTPETECHLIRFIPPPTKPETQTTVAKNIQSHAPHSHTQPDPWEKQSDLSRYDQVGLAVGVGVLMGGFIYMVRKRRAQVNV